MFPRRAPCIRRFVGSRDDDCVTASRFCHRQAPVLSGSRSAPSQQVYEIIGGVNTSAMTRRDLLAAAATAFTTRADAALWKAGVATIDITPDAPLWMAGFAARKQAAQGTALPLKAKALALQAGNDRPAVLVTTDLLGLTATITDAVAA